MIRLCTKLSKDETLNMTNDVVKILTIAITYQLFSYAIDDDRSILDELILKRFIYLTIGVIIFNLFTKRFFTPNQDRKLKNKKHKKKRNYKSNNGKSNG